jgi:hypothetical protein
MLRSLNNWLVGKEFKMNWNLTGELGSSYPLEKALKIIRLFG